MGHPNIHGDKYHLPLPHVQEPHNFYPYSLPTCVTGELNRLWDALASKDQTIAALTERVRVLEEALRAIRNRRVTEPEEHWNSDQWNEAYQTWILEARGDAAAALAKKELDE